MTFSDQYDLTARYPTLKPMPTPQCQAGAESSPQPALARLSTPELRKLPYALLEGMVTDVSLRSALSTRFTAQGFSGFIPSERSGVYDRQMGSSIPDPNTLASLQNIASRMAAEIRDQPGGLAGFSGCAASTPSDPSCMRTFIQRLTDVAFTHALTDNSLNGVRDELVSQVAQGQDWLRSALVFVLVAPASLNRVELGAPQGQGWVPLTDAELAQRLASVFWNSPWDNQLRVWARAGQIKSQYEVVLNYIFGSPRFSDRNTGMMRDFAWNYLRLHELAPFQLGLNPSVTDRLAATGLSSLQGATNYVQLAQDEALEYFMRHLQTASSFEAFFTGRQAYGTGNLATAQGISGTYPASYPPGTKLGPFSLSALHLSGGPHKNHIKAGYRFLKIFLCGKVPSPAEANVSAEALVLPPLNGLASSRQQQQMHTQPPSCFGCHSAFNHWGFMLGKLDHMGVFRGDERVYNTSTHEFLGSLPVDDEISFNYGQNTVSLAGPTEAAEFLLQTRIPQLCFARQFTLHAFGREFQRGGEEGCALQSMLSRLSNPQASMVEALKDLARSRIFQNRYRGGP